MESVLVVGIKKKVLLKNSESTQQEVRYTLLRWLLVDDTMEEQEQQEWRIKRGEHWKGVQNVESLKVGTSILEGVTTVFDQEHKRNFSRLTFGYMRLMHLRRQCQWRQIGSTVKCRVGRS